jgi:hypothetical protein
MADPYAKAMKMWAKAVLGACAAMVPLADAPAFAAPTVQDSVQEAARQRRLQGHNLPVREIERRVIPQVPNSQYLGFDFDPGSDVYTLKFLRNGSVIWVEVDGRTARIIRRMGN